MAELITSRYQGSSITLAVTGLPVTITGEVIGGESDTMVTLKLKNGKIVYIASNLIAFFF